MPTVSGTTVECKIIWSTGPNCTHTLQDALPNVWLSWQVTVWTLQGLVVLLAAWNAFTRARVLMCSRGEALRHSAHVRVGGLRDTCMLMTVTGSVLRICWVLDPAFQKLYTVSEAIVLLRGPQVLFHCALCTILLVWSMIIGAARPKSFRKRRMVALVGVTALLLIGGVAVSTILLGTLHNQSTFVRQTLRFVADGTSSMFVIVFCVFGLVYGRRLYRVLVVHLPHASRAARPRLLGVIEHTLVTLVAAAVFGVISVATWSTDVILNITPESSPKWFMFMLFMLHAVAEPGLAFTLVYASWVHVPAEQPAAGKLRRASQSGVPDPHAAPAGPLLQDTSGIQSGGLAYGTQPPPRRPSTRAQQLSKVPRCFTACVLRFCASLDQCCSGRHTTALVYDRQQGHVTAAPRRGSTIADPLAPLGGDELYMPESDDAYSDDSYRDSSDSTAGVRWDRENLAKESSTLAMLHLSDHLPGEPPPR